MTRKPFSLAFSDYANSNPQLLSTYIQLFEATGRKPKLSEFSKTKFTNQIGYLLDEDFEKAWQIFGGIVESKLSKLKSATKD